MYKYKLIRNQADVTDMIVFRKVKLSEVGGSLLRCGMLSGKNCEDQR